MESNVVTTKSMIERWEALARDISQAVYDPSKRGDLVVIGSGLCYIDFARDSDDQIQSADAVFHCVYDKVTQVRIGQLRPDAYDLRILYGEDVDRHMTYVRMAEAMLHFVRSGKKVVAVFYGHPGVFAMPAHRAIHIARQEGHTAQMRPGISALDYLIADLGFDPALPGMSSFEATDLLLRRRRIDPSLHIILWQVGVVGEFQFQPGGFENRGFDLLMSELSGVYGDDWIVTHYIAPQYVGIEPLIEKKTIAEWSDLENRKLISSLSTFYIEPRQTTETNEEIARELGFIKEGQPVPDPFRLYDYTRYGRREQLAVRNFARFQTPPHYKLAPLSPEFEFMFELSRDLKMQAEYVSDPNLVVGRSAEVSKNKRSARLLAIAHPKAIDAALSEYVTTQNDLQLSQENEQRS